jgi:acyl carrier protein
MSEFKDKLKQFIMTEVNPERDLAEIGDDEPLLESAIIDSLGILKILAFMDEEFGVDLSSDQIKLENFRDVATINRLFEQSGK